MEVARRLIKSQDMLSSEGGGERSLGKGGTLQGMGGKNPFTKIKTPEENETGGGRPTGHPRSRKKDGRRRNRLKTARQYGKGEHYTVKKEE